MLGFQFGSDGILLLDRVYSLTSSASWYMQEEQCYYAGEPPQLEQEVKRAFDCLQEGLSQALHMNAHGSPNDPRNNVTLCHHTERLTLQLRGNVSDALQLRCNVFSS